MPTELLDFQHEILADIDAATGLVFGKVGTSYFTMEHPQIVGGDDIFGDVAYEREDGIAFGEDYVGAKAVTFEIGVQGWDADNPHVAGADALETLEATWRDPEWRTSAIKYAVLRSRAVPGRVRRCYGRPRRFAETTSRLTHRGFSTVICDFQTRDSRWYDDVAQEATCALVAPPAGGLTAPLVAPLTTVPSAGGRDQSVVVGGTVETWPEVTITAGPDNPASEPVVKIGALTIAFSGQLLPGESVTFDPRPWQRTVLLNDGGSWAGKLTWATPPMEECYVKPGTHLFTFTANDPSATASARLRWRDAYARW